MEIAACLYSLQFAGFFLDVLGLLVWVDISRRNGDSCFCFLIFRVCSFYVLFSALGLGSVCDYKIRVGAIGKWAF